MPTWSDAQDFICRQFALERELATDTPEDLALLFSVEVLDGRADTQHVEILHEVWEGESWLLACAELCAADALTAVDALLIGAMLRVGALVLDAPMGVQWAPTASTEFVTPARYLVRRAWALRNLHFDDLARELRTLAHEAMAARTYARPLLPPPERVRQAGHPLFAANSSEQ